MVNSNQTQKDLMEPQRQKRSHHSPKPTNNEENKIIKFWVFLRGLNEKKRLTAQNVQNSRIWCPISITKQILMFWGWFSVIDPHFKSFRFFISGVISFTILQILLSKFTSIHSFYIYVGT